MGGSFKIPTRPSLTKDDEINRITDIIQKLGEDIIQKSGELSTWKNVVPEEGGKKITRKMSKTDKKDEMDKKEEIKKEVEKIPKKEKEVISLIGELLSLSKEKDNLTSQITVANTSKTDSSLETKTPAKPETKTKTKKVSRHSSSKIIKRINGLTSEISGKLAELEVKFLESDANSIAYKSVQAFYEKHPFYHRKTFLDEPLRKDDPQKYKEITRSVSEKKQESSNPENNNAEYINTSVSEKNDTETIIRELKVAKDLFERMEHIKTDLDKAEEHIKQCNIQYGKEKVELGNSLSEESSTKYTEIESLHGLLKERFKIEKDVAENTKKMRNQLDRRVDENLSQISNEIDEHYKDSGLTEQKASLIKIDLAKGISEIIDQFIIEEDYVKSHDEQRQEPQIGKSGFGEKYRNLNERLKLLLAKQPSQQYTDIEVESLFGHLKEAVKIKKEIKVAKNKHDEFKKRLEENGRQISQEVNENKDWFGEKLKTYSEREKLVLGICKTIDSSTKEKDDIGKLSKERKELQEEIDNFKKKYEDLNLGENPIKTLDHTIRLLKEGIKPAEEKYIAVRYNEDVIGNDNEYSMANANPGSDENINIYGGAESPYSIENESTEPNEGKSHIYESLPEKETDPADFVGDNKSKLLQELADKLGETAAIEEKQNEFKAKAETFGGLATNYLERKDPQLAKLEEEIKLIEKKITVPPLEPLSDPKVEIPPPLPSREGFDEMVINHKLKNLNAEKKKLLTSPEHKDLLEKKPEEAKSRLAEIDKEIDALKKSLKSLEAKSAHPLSTSPAPPDGGPGMPLTPFGQGKQKENPKELLLHNEEKSPTQEVPEPKKPNKSM